MITARGIAPTATMRRRAPLRASRTATRPAPPRAAPVGSSAGPATKTRPDRSSMPSANGTSPRRMVRSRAPFRVSSIWSRWPVGRATVIESAASATKARPVAASTAIAAAPPGTGTRRTIDPVSASRMVTRPPRGTPSGPAVLLLPTKTCLRGASMAMETGPPSYWEATSTVPRVVPGVARSRRPAPRATSATSPTGSSAKTVRIRLSTIAQQGCAWGAPERA